MRSEILTLSAVLCVALATGCGGGDDDDDGGGGSAATGTGGGAATGTGGGGGATQPPPACVSLVRDVGDDGLPIIVANGVNNYTFTSSLSLEESVMVPRTDYGIDWSGVTLDFRQHAVDPVADIDMVQVVLWKLSRADLQVGINADSLAMRDLELIATIDTDHVTTAAHMSDLTLNQQPIDNDLLMNALDPTVYDPATHSYTIMVAEGTMMGQGYLMLKSFRVDPAGTETELVLTSNSAQLAFEADLEALTPTYLPVGDAGFVMDWTAMEDGTTGAGTPFNPNEITEVMVAKYSTQLSTPAELEQRFLDIDLIADPGQLYRGPVSIGTSLALNTLTNDTGAPFAGIDDQGMWILALTCGSCANPAPWYLTILAPCTP